MGWGRSNIEALINAGTVPVSVVLRVRRNAAGGGVGGEYLVSSSTSHGADALLDPGTLRIDPERLSVQTWITKPGQFKVSILLPDYSAYSGAGGRVSAAAVPSRNFVRGALVELLIGSGDDLSTYRAMHRGRIQRTTALGRDVAEVEVYSLLYSLKGRPYPELSGGTEPQTRLFHGICGEETTSATTYTAGSSTSILLADASSFVTFNGTGVAKITGNTGAQFYVTFTGKTGSTLTGVSTTGKFGTTAENASAGNTVQSVAYLAGHPITIAERLLVSTGAGTNGAEDVLPEAAGFALDAEWVDSAQMREVRGTVVKAASGSYEWELLVEEPVEDGLTWLQDHLNEAGIWLCERQGQIVARASQDLNAYATCGQAFEITDADIIGSPSVQWANPDTPFGYQQVVINYSAGTATSEQDATSLPARDEITYDMEERVRSNAVAIGAELLDRLKPYGHWIGEVITLTIRSAWWGLCVGDVIPLTTVRARGRFVSTYGGYDQRPCLVLSASADPIRGVTTLTLLSMPLTPGDDHA